MIQKPFERFSFVPVSEEGKREYIFAYRDNIPSKSEEPGLFNRAIIIRQESDEVELHYANIEEIVLLLTLDADDRFRREHPDLVSQNELFMLESNL